MYTKTVGGKFPMASILAVTQNFKKHRQQKWNWTSVTVTKQKASASKGSPGQSEALPSTFIQFFSTHVFCLQINSLLSLLLRYSGSTLKDGSSCGDFLRVVREGRRWDGRVKKREI